MDYTTIDLSILCTKSSSSSSDASTTALLLIDCHNELGEGIIYDDINHCILWTDILQKQFHILQLPQQNSDDSDDATPVAKHYIIKELPKMLGSFGLLLQNNPSTTTTTTNDDETSVLSSLPLLCAWEDGFQLYDMMQRVALSDMSTGECVNPIGLPSRLNDGRVDHDGQYYICGGYFGSIPTNVNQMKVYRVKQHKSDSNAMSWIHEPIIQSITTTNSICWSTDGKQMYVADSPTKTIVSYEYHDGTISATSTVVHRIDEHEIDVPDGSCVDSDGFVWNAKWCSGKKQSYVHRIDPSTGHIVYTVHIPYQTSQITCCCFGRIYRNDPHYNILFITTAGESIHPPVREPHAGGLFAIKVPFHGKPEARLQWKL